MATGSNRILGRLQELESAQRRVMSEMQSKHNAERAELLARIEEANERRRRAELSTGDPAAIAAPTIMEVSMSEIDAAVQAAQKAQAESTAALKEAEDVVERAKAVSGQGSHALAITDGSDAQSNGGDGVGYGQDSEFIVKEVSVNLDEVERIINNSPLVEVCRAFGRPDAKYGNEVYCCVVPKRNVRVSEPMLMLHAQKYLSTALCPKRFFFLESLPSGITRKALADTRISEMGATGSAPAGSNGQAAPAPPKSTSSSS